ncbi:MAG: CRISPR system precrRNA processing endoribonuclease RAMP protein Cas6 [Bryobacteraceae bacterium]
MRFGFRPQDSLRFPPGKAGNTLRGAFGLVSNPELFAPKNTGGPSGLADPPRSFVFRAHHLDGRTIPPKDYFHFDVHLFDTSLAREREFKQAMIELAAAGLGPDRVPLTLVDHSSELIAVPLAPTSSLARLRLLFLTPTELKTQGETVAQPYFGPLFARIRDRVATLRALYGEGPLDLNFRLLAELAEQIQMTRCDIRHEDVERRSSRSGQRHPLGGFVGEAVYEGDLSPFLGWLRAAEFCGVGRQTVWGKGVVQIAT